MSLLNEEVRGQLSEVFEGMGNDVTIALFTKEDNCETCSDTKSFMEEVSTLSDQLNLEVYDLDEDSEKAEAFKVDKVPAIVLLDADKKYQGVKFYGIPAGHEINSFVTGIMEVSGVGEDLPDDLLEQIKGIDKDVDIKVFVTLSCPHCPGAVAKAHKLALLNDKISGEMIEAQTFSELSQKFDVSGVPKIVINDEFELVGNQPLDKFLEEIGKIN